MCTLTPSSSLVALLLLGMVGCGPETPSTPPITDGGDADTDTDSDTDADSDTDTDTDTDSGAGADSGSSADSGIASDSGSSSDTGTSTDSGVVIGDSGSPGDSGTSTDSGTSGDTGVSTDSGVVVGDSGSAGDTGISTDSDVIVGDSGTSGDTGTSTDSGVVIGDSGQFGDTGTSTDSDVIVGDSGQSGDTGVSTDSGVIVGDSGTSGDTGTSTDSGAVEDSVPPVDTGTGTDSGVVVDSGPPVDTGASADSGVITGDSGNLGDSGISTDSGVVVDSDPPPDTGVVVRDSDGGNDTGSTADDTGIVVDDSDPCTCDSADTDGCDTACPDSADSVPDTGSDTGSSDTGNPDTESPDTGNPDTGAPDTGSLPDSDSVTDTAPDTGTDTGPIDTGPVDTGPTCGLVVERDTAEVDLGAGEPSLTSFDTGNPDYFDTGVDPDCSVSNEADGHLRLECATVVWEVDGIAWTTGPGQMFWLGDLDGDGRDDFSGHRFNYTDYLLFYGPEVLDDWALSSSIEDAADAWHTRTSGLYEAVPYHASDVTGDGVPELYAWENGGHYIVTSDGTRFSGDTSTFGTPIAHYAGSWGIPEVIQRQDSPYEAPGLTYSFSMGWDYDGMDLDGDGLGDIMYGYNFVPGANVVADGDLPPASGTSWEFDWPDYPWSATRYVPAYQMYYPVGDTNADGSDEILNVVSSYWNAPSEGALLVIEPRDLPYCSFHPDDVARVRIDAMATTYGRDTDAFYIPTQSSTTAAMDAGDLNNDGYDDILFSGSNRVYLLYGGETLLTQGGDIGDGSEFPADRIETSRTLTDGEWLALWPAPQVSDFNGDGANELYLTGQTWGCRDSATPQARGRVPIWVGGSAGIRGVNSIDDATINLVGPPGTCEIFPALGHGDADGDTMEDLLVIGQTSTDQGFVWLWSGSALGL